MGLEFRAWFAVVRPSTRHFVAAQDEDPEGCTILLLAEPRQRRVSKHTYWCKRRCHIRCKARQPMSLRQNPSGQSMALTAA